VHSDVGNFAQNALINNQSTSLFSQISEWDVVRVLLAQEKQVTRSWLTHTKDPFTLKKIHEAIWR
jgi:(p)ppGpp synthase/HD superfamily hydrolase